MLILSQQNANADNKTGSMRGRHVAEEETGEADAIQPDVLCRLDGEVSRPDTLTQEDWVGTARRLG